MCIIQIGICKAFSSLKVFHIRYKFGQVFIGIYDIWKMNKVLKCNFEDNVHADHLSNIYNFQCFYSQSFEGIR